MVSNVIRALQAALLQARLHETRAAKELQSAEAQLMELEQVLDTLQGYANDYRQTISAMDQASVLGVRDLNQRQLLLAMTRQVDAMRSAQLVQAERQRNQVAKARSAWQQLHLRVEKLGELIETRRHAGQLALEKKRELASADDFLTHLAAFPKNP